jgi:PAS domain S-box-containing protein
MHAGEPMVLTDPAQPDHPMVAVNDAFAAVTLYPARETVGRNCRFLQGEATDKKATARIRQCIAEERGCVEWVVNYRRDGTMFWNLLFLSPVFAPDGTLLHYFGNQRDITAGPPADLPDYTLGKADMTLEGEADFQTALRVLLGRELTADDTAHGLQTLVEAARRLDQATRQLAPAPWELPGVAR